MIDKVSNQSRYDLSYNDNHHNDREKGSNTNYLAGEWYKLYVALPKLKKRIADVNTFLSVSLFVPLSQPAKSSDELLPQ